MEVIKYYNDFMSLSEISGMNYNKGIEILPEKAAVVIENVSFSYPGSSRQILKDISFSINSNQKVAVVGKNGAGKSTIVKLLLNLYPADSGKIYFNGNFISPVFQDYVNYFLTIRENVALGDIKYKNDDLHIEETLKSAHIHEITCLSKNGLNTNLGKIENDGVDLSAGQWQHLAVARGLFPKNSFIILDEPTASMDPVAESQLYEYFLKTISGRGCLIISHRLASAKLEDLILVLDNGSIVESGNHNELMKRKGLYYNMFTLQSSWYDK
jgi:ATP-binding cassette subfamily B protein